MTLPLRLIKDSQRQGFIENCRAGSYPILRMIEILSWGINDLRCSNVVKRSASIMQYSKNSFGKSNIFLVAAPTNHRMLDAPRLSYCPDCSRHREIGSNIILIWFHIEKNGGNILTSYFLESKYRRHFLQSKCK